MFKCPGTCPVRLPCPFPRSAADRFSQWWFQRKLATLDQIMTQHFVGSKSLGHNLWLTNISEFSKCLFINFKNKILCGRWRFSICQKTRLLLVPASLSSFALFSFFDSSFWVFSFFDDSNVLTRGDFEFPTRSQKPNIRKRNHKLYFKWNDSLLRNTFITKSIISNIKKSAKCDSYNGGRLGMGWLGRTWIEIINTEFGTRSILRCSYDSSILPEITKTFRFTQLEFFTKTMRLRIVTYSRFIRDFVGRNF